MNALDVALAWSRKTPFLDAMRAKWAEYGNVESPALWHVKTQIEATLNQQAGPDARDVWPVIPCELGAGKSTAAKVWCAVNETRPGVLVVVRTKDQADEYAREHQRLVGRAGARLRALLRAPTGPAPKPGRVGVLPGAGGVSQII